MSENKTVEGIKAFNRDYTDLIGLMNQYVLDSEYSLYELRILYEIHSKEKCTSKDIKNKIDIDGGYLSRVLKELEKSGLIKREIFDEDKRYSYVALTKEGKERYVQEENVCNQQIETMIQHLSDKEKSEMLQSMNKIIDHLNPNISKEGNDNSKLLDLITIRETLKPGDIGYLIYLHGIVYNEESGYDIGFEGYVCNTFYEFSKTYSSDKDRIFLACHNNEIIGSIAIVGHTTKEAQLRWYLIEPKYRGIGLGKMLYEKALDYAKEKGYKKLWLVTTKNQEKAVNIYEASGFKEVSQTIVDMRGKSFVEVRYELDLEN
jgi:DNA-binding MarR family transcriptional regulator/GNAT superfamily N-acetyltransferase